MTTLTKIKLVHMLGEYKGTGKYHSIAKMAREIAEKTGTKTWTVRQEINALKNEDPEFFGYFGKGIEGWSGKGRTPIFSKKDVAARINMLAAKGEKFNSMALLCDDISKKLGMTVGYAYVLVAKDPAMSIVAKTLVRSVSEKQGMDGQAFTFNESAGIHPQYLLGLMDRIGSFWFLFNENKSHPYPMFTASYGDEKVLQTMCSALGTGRVKLIPGSGTTRKYKYYVSSFDECKAIRKFLEIYSPIYKAESFQNWCGIWDQIARADGPLVQNPAANRRAWKGIIQGVNEQPDEQGVKIPQGRLSPQYVAGIIDALEGNPFQCYIESGKPVPKIVFTFKSEPFAEKLKEFFGGIGSKVFDVGRGRYRFQITRSDVFSAIGEFSEYPPIAKLEKFLVWKGVAEYLRKAGMPETANEWALIKEASDKLRE